ncbi:lipase [Lentzea sp. NBRC 105346]|uniref:esterase/lipase family protein n=1 Tax=Lentzea sp. NBRC 105346 TaxID=3032205 RepID=UPI00255268E2|nr:alpha/beta fold hydrolase [Lentzea sp. NBRC 105346]GLZ30404.1 lipase [Lentzea sp. NBRC 105346]
MGKGVLQRLTDALVERAGWGVHTAQDIAEEAKVALRAMATPGGMRGVVVEAAWLAAHTVLYPWGVIEEQLRPDGHYRHFRTDKLPPRQRGLVVSAMDAAGTPIVLVHGIGDNRSAFAVLSGALRRRGFGVVHAVNYSVLTALTGDVRRSAALLGAHIERICEQTGSDQVHVVGHSLGGLIARYYVQRLHGDSRVRSLVTLGTPHHGTLAAYLLPTPLTKQLRPGSDLLTELAEPTRPCRTRFVVVWSEMDQIIVPQRNARLDHPSLVVEEHQIRDSGHLSLPVDTRTLHVVVTAITRSDDSVTHPIVAGSEACQPPEVTDGHSAQSQPSG